MWGSADINQMTENSGAAFSIALEGINFNNTYNTIFFNNDNR